MRWWITSLSLLFSISTYFSGSWDPPPDQLAPGSALFVLLRPTVFAGINFLREGDRPVWSIGRFFLGFNRRGLLIQELAGSQLQLVMSCRIHHCVLDILVTIIVATAGASEHEGSVMQQR
jgi:hypothetical protein